MARLFLLNITMYIFYVAACILFKICLFYILLELAQYTNIFNKKLQVSRFQIIVREKLYLKMEAERIKKSLIEIK